MADLNIDVQLDELRSRYTDQLVRLQDEAKVLESEIQRITASFHELELRRELASQKLYKVQQILRGLVDTEKEETLEIILAGFWACQKEMFTILGPKLDSRLGLENQIQQILIRDPDLKSALEEYDQFNANIDSVLSAVPPYYKEKILAAHSRLKERLAEILALKAELEKYSNSNHLIFPIVQTINDAHDQVYWAFPYAVNVISHNESFELRMNAVENAFQRSMGFLAGEMETILPDFEPHEWAGYHGITTLSDEKNNLALASIVVEHLREKLVELWPFPGQQIEVHILPVDWEIWKDGEDKELVIDTTLESDIGLIIKPITANPLFTDRDLVSWDRPLKVGADSLWTVNARRLRTMFVRLIAQGRVGRSGVLIPDLLSGLPTIHEQAFQTMLPMLIDTEILINHSADINSLCVNPEQLPNIQDLINRDITAFWTPIVPDSLFNMSN